MSFSDNIEYLMAHPGTVAVLIWRDGVTLPDKFRGHTSWLLTLGDAISMLGHSRETFASATIGEHSILAETRDGQQCAVVYPTNTPAAKVMRRMLRNAAGPKRSMRKVTAPGQRLRRSKMANTVRSKSARCGLSARTSSSPRHLSGGALIA